MSAPVRLQISRCKGFDLQALSRAANGLPAVSVARPSVFGNPWIFGVPGFVQMDWQNSRRIELKAPSLTREQAVSAYRLWIKGRTAHWPWEMTEPYIAWKVRALYRLPELRGKNLACWCPLTDAEGKPVPCHADILLELANP